MIIITAKVKATIVTNIAEGAVGARDDVRTSCAYSHFIFTTILGGRHE